MRLLFGAKKTVRESQGSTAQYARQTAAVLKKLFLLLVIIERNVYNGKYS